MDRYYYYTYEFRNSRRASVCKYIGEFDLADAMMILHDYFGEPIVITNWKEISSNQYEKFKEIIDELNK